MKRLESEKELRREEIIRQLKAGADIEKGSLTAEMVPTETVYFTAAAGTKLITLDVVSAIKGQIPPTKGERLNVTECDSSA